MRIGFDAKRFFHNDRGLGNYSRNLISGLVKYAPDHNYFLYDSKPDFKLMQDDFRTSESLRIVSSKFNSISNSFWRTFNLGKTYKKDNLDIFHGLSMEIPRDHKRGGIPTVVTVHDLIFLKHPEFYTLPDRLIHQAKLKHALKHSDIIVAISRQTRDDIIDYLPEVGDKIRVVYQSCNELFFSRRNEEEKLELANRLSLPKKFWLCVGALTENKNIKLVLQAMSIIGKDNCPPLVIVGKGKQYRSLLEDYAKRKGLSSHLHFVNDILDPSPIQLSSLYQLASLFIFPSFYEGFGIPILESRASMIPVVASNSTCLDEAGEDAIDYFDPEDPDSLVNAIDHSEQQKLLSPDNFKLENSTRKLLDIYQLFSK